MTPKPSVQSHLEMYLNILVPLAMLVPPYHLKPLNHKSDILFRFITVQLTQ